MISKENTFLNRYDVNSKKLLLSDCNLVDKQAKDLVSFNWDQVESLDLSKNSLTVTGLEIISQGKWPNLKELYLSNNNVGGGLKHLAAFSKLSVLGLTDCNITDDDVKELVALPWDNLESIWISYNKIGIKGVNCFISHKWPKLVSLHFSGNPLHDDGLKALLQFDWSRLKRLFLSGCLISDVGIDYITLCDWPNLQVLKLNRNSVTSKGISQLSKKPWKSLTNLHIRDNKIDDQGGLGVVEGEWPSLKTIKLDRNNLSQEVRKRIRQRFFAQNVEISF